MTLLAFLSGVDADAAKVAVDEGRAFANAVLESTSREWSDTFAGHGRRYDPPNVIFLQPPRHHPSRGFGYTRNFAVIVDLGEMADIETVFGNNADALMALVIGHEVAHHVQHLNQVYRRAPAASGPAFELEADCAAGWWLSQANRRSVAAIGKPLYPVPDLERQLPRFLQALEVLRQGLTLSRDGTASTNHGLAAERAGAMRRGLAAGSPAGCGAGVLP